MHSPTLLFHVFPYVNFRCAATSPRERFHQVRDRAACPCRHLQPLPCNWHSTAKAKEKSLFNPAVKWLERGRGTGGSSYRHSPWTHSRQRPNAKNPRS